jgi:hypothetical protein
VSARRDRGGIVLGTVYRVLRHAVVSCHNPLGTARCRRISNLKSATSILAHHFTTPRKAREARSARIWKRSRQKVSRFEWRPVGRRAVPASDGRKRRK